MGDIISILYDSFYSTGFVSVHIEAVGECASIQKQNKNRHYTPPLSEAIYLTSEKLNSSEEFNILYKPKNDSPPEKDSSKKDTPYIFDDISIENDFDTTSKKEIVRDAPRPYPKRSRPNPISGLKTNHIVEYLESTDREHGLPIFVDNGKIDLNYAETLHVVMSYLMDDFYSLSKSRKSDEEIWELTSRNIETLQGYLPENMGDNSALEFLINVGIQKQLSAFATHYNQRSHGNRRKNPPQKTVLTNKRFLNDWISLNDNQPTKQVKAVQWF